MAYPIIHDYRVLILTDPWSITCCYHRETSSVSGSLPVDTTCLMRFARRVPRDCGSRNLENRETSNVSQLNHSDDEAQGWWNLNKTSSSLSARQTCPKLLCYTYILLFRSQLILRIVTSLHILNLSSWRVLSHFYIFSLFSSTQLFYLLFLGRLFALRD